MKRHLVEKKGTYSILLFFFFITGFLLENKLLAPLPTQTRMCGSSWKIFFLIIAFFFIIENEFWKDFNFFYSHQPNEKVCLNLLAYKRKTCDNKKKNHEFSLPKFFVVVVFLRINYIFILKNIKNRFFFKTEDVAKEEHFSTTWSFLLSQYCPGKKTSKLVQVHHLTGNFWLSWIFTK